jgi:hypothetical protein
VFQVFDQHGRILATILTIPAARLRPTDNTRIAFDENPAGSPHARPNSLQRCVTRTTQAGSTLDGAGEIRRPAFVLTP